MLLVGDAFITTAQKPEMHGPPMYYTLNWEQARVSVEHLARLKPEVAVTGHGMAMQGQEMRVALQTLARDFNRVAVPDGGRYVEDPARVSDGSANVKAE